MEDNIKNM